MLNKIFLLFHILYFLPVIAATGEEYIPCIVETVHDGNSITVSDHTGRHHRVQLYGVKTPTLDQDFGIEPFIFLKSMIAGKEVSLAVVGRDSLNIPNVRLHHNDVDVNAALLESGYAWLDPSSCNHAICDQWRAQQDSAKKRHIGIWGILEEVEPWIWFAPKESTGPMTQQLDSRQNSDHTTPLLKAQASRRDTQKYTVKRGRTTINAYEYNPYPKSGGYLIPIYRKPKTKKTNPGGLQWQHPTQTKQK